MREGQSHILWQVGGETDPTLASEVTSSTQELGVIDVMCQLPKRRRGTASACTQPAAAAAAKLLQSCLTLCDPIDGSPPGSPSLGFSRQEHWSGLPLPSPHSLAPSSFWLLLMCGLCVCEKWDLSSLTRD